MTNTKYNIHSYIKSYPDFAKFINGEYNDLDDAKYAELFFKEMYRFNWFDIYLDILELHVFKPKFEKIFIEELIINDSWSNSNISVLKTAIERGYVNTDYYYNIFISVLAKDNIVSAALFYNLDGFKQYNDIIESKCIANASGSQLTDIIQEKSVDTAMKKIALNRIASMHKAYANKAIDAIAETEDLVQRNELLQTAVDKIVNECTIDHFCYMMTFYDISLPSNVASKIHDDYGDNYFKDNIRSFERIRRYCYTFGSALNEYEADVFTKRLQTKTRNKYIKKALEKVNFNDKQKEKLNSCILLYQLSN